MTNLKVFVFEVGFRVASATVYVSDVLPADSRL